ncbi:MAG TPA: GFA family protein [Caulobacteraceae bacterium]|jgi:hypothetical protein
MDTDLTGRCTCGHVHYRLAGRPMITHGCHCLSCQRETGGAFAINALYEADRVTLTAGEVEEIATPTDSGTPQLIQRCPHCKVALWSHYGGRRHAAFVRVGTLETPHALAPDVHIFVRSKVPWVRLPQGVPAFDVYYDVPAVWPAESLARRDAAMRAAGA